MSDADKRLSSSEAESPKLFTVAINTSEDYGGFQYIFRMHASRTFGELRDEIRHVLRGSTLLFNCKGKFETIVHASDNNATLDSVMPNGPYQLILRVVRGCAGCMNQPGNLTCPQCVFVGYCSKGCQLDHWPVHKCLCRASLLTSQRRIWDTSELIMRMSEIEQRLELAQAKALGTELLERNMQSQNQALKKENRKLRHANDRLRLPKTPDKLIDCLESSLADNDATDIDRLNNLFMGILRQRQKAGRYCVMCFNGPRDCPMPSCKTPSQHGIICKRCLADTLEPQRCPACAGTLSVDGQR